jgi:hypothetical protein
MQLSGGPTFLKLTVLADYGAHMVQKSVLVASAILALTASGCGGGSGGSSAKNEAGVRATVREFLRDLRDSKFGDACDLMTKAQQAATGDGNATKCASQLALGKAFLGESTIDGYLREVDAMKVTIHGNHATSTSLGGDKTISQYVYAGGRWLSDVDAAGGSSGGSGPTAERAKTWPTKWCQASVGMTRAQMRALMGPPSDEVQQNDSSGDPQMSWDYAEYQFNAFMDVNDRVRQLDTNDIQLSASEKAAIHCPSTRT